MPREFNYNHWRSPSPEKLLASQRAGANELTYDQFIGKGPNPFSQIMPSIQFSGRCGTNQVADEVFNWLEENCSTHWFWIELDDSRDEPPKTYIWLYDQETALAFKMTWEPMFQGDGWIPEENVS